MDELDLPGESRAPAFEEEEDERYLIRSRTEIASLLGSVSARHALSRVSFNHDQEFILTTLLLVDAAQDHLVFEAGPDDERNQRLLEAERMIFVTQLDKIKIQFRMESVEQVEYEGALAFLAPLPESILRLQRREYFRATALVSQPITGRIALETEQGINRQTMRGIDISLGGVALLAGSTLETVKVGDVFAKAELNLPGVGEITADLEVLNIRPQHSGGHLCSRFGCRFVNLAPAMASKVQRYINRLELERAHRI